MDCEKGITTPGNMTLRTVEDARAFGELYTSASKITIEGQEFVIGSWGACGRRVDLAMLDAPSAAQW